jgi:glutamine synthetase
VAQSANNMTDLVAAAKELGVDRVQVLFADQHGLLKGRAVRVDYLAEVQDQGLGVPGSLLAKDTGGAYAVPVWAPSGDEVLDQLVGARNMLLFPDPSTLRPMPWSPHSAMVLSDLHTTDGEPIPHSARAVARRQLDDLASRGWQMRAGLEYEFHLYRSQPDEAVVHGHAGWDLLGAEALDSVDDVLQPIVQGLTDMGLPPVTVEVELGPSQVELTFDPDMGITIADHAVMVRHAVRAVAKRNGCHATFMSRPAVGDSFSSGWHLHQSLVEEDGGGAVFRTGQADDLSDVGSAWIAGLLEHAAAACLLTTPTVTGYKRFRPRAVTPDRVSWSRQHRGAMLRLVGAGDSLRVENRAGDPAANPYLYLASQVACGLIGVDEGLRAPEPTEDPYSPAGGDLLPRSLGEAIDDFDGDETLQAALGGDVASYLLSLKRSEWGRFLSAVTDWEQQEYFTLF